MKISGSGPIRRTSESGRPKKKGAGKGADFAAELDDAATDKSATVSGAGPVAAVDALLSVQEVGDATSGRSRGAVRAQLMIDGLDDIRQGLLMGSIPRSKLASLVEVVREEREQAEDPRLSAILDEIELRAAVELAKLDQLV
ncbi:MAG: flagellar assembly protein FliX [Alphaproteobacteria bacterium]|jgi:hypothetical protein|nr:flagellar assembly protein FliX [Alphaproteobacteria bacterium]MBT5860392.1 flagellar assembly protein FliX [Alphaproteobacteria bacterium]